MLAFMVATFADLFIRVILCYALDPVLHTEGIWWSWPIGWTAATIVSIALYLSNRWYKSQRAKSIFSALDPRPVPAEYALTSSEENDDSKAVEKDAENPRAL